MLATQSESEKIIIIIIIRSQRRSCIMFHNISRTPLRRYYKINQAQSPLILFVHVIDLHYHLSRDVVRIKERSFLRFSIGIDVTLLWVGAGSQRGVMTTFHSIKNCFRRLREKSRLQKTSQLTNRSFTTPSTLIQARSYVNTPRELIIARDELNHR